MSAKYGTIKTYGEMLIKDTQVLVTLGSRSPTIIRDYRQRLEGHCIPFFGSQSIRTINTRRLKEFVAWLTDKQLKATSIHAILSFVSKVLKLAAEDGVINTVPMIPRPPLKDSPRPWLSKPEYASLLRVLRKIERENPPVLVRHWPIDKELRYYVTFLVNAFLRPGDAMNLQNRHVTIVDEADRRFLRINAPTSKTTLSPVITMPVAVDIYRRLRDRNKKLKLNGDDDYVFLPKYCNRNYAQEIFRRQLDHVLQLSNLKLSPANLERTTYSLRHTAIMLRLINSKGLDLLTLARNCQTSVEMIDRFYAKHLTAEMNLEKLQSMRHPNRYV